VREGLLSERAFARLWCLRPAEVFAIPVNRFAKGDSADFFLFDPDESWVPSRETLHSKSLNTPFLGRTLKGRVTAHWMQGRKLL
jgi:dihydroorotase